MDKLYYIIPSYLVPLKGCDDKFKQHFKDIYSVIDSKNFSNVEKGSEEFSKVEESLQLITDALNVNTHNIDVDAVHEAFILLVEKAELNKDIIYSILNCQADITYPKEWKDDSPEPHLDNIVQKKCKSTCMIQ